MRKISKITLILVTLSLVAVLAGCGGDPTISKEKTPYEKVVATNMKVVDDKLLCDKSETVYMTEKSKEVISIKDLVEKYIMADFNRDYRNTDGTSAHYLYTKETLDDLIAKKDAEYFEKSYKEYQIVEKVSKVVVDSIKIDPRLNGKGNVNAGTITYFGEAKVYYESTLDAKKSYLDSQKIKANIPYRQYLTITFAVQNDVWKVDGCTLDKLELINK